MGKTIQEVSKTPQKEEVYAQLLQEATQCGHWQGELLEEEVGNRIDVDEVVQASAPSAVTARAPEEVARITAPLEVMSVDPPGG